MRKLSFFLPLLLLFFVVFPKDMVWADSSTESAVISPTPAIDYTLPYPGILPDNPLYVLKTFRDRIILFFISSPVKKSSFYLLQSDKRLEASWYLLKRDNKSQSLAATTLSKSTNYLSQSLDMARQAVREGDDMGDIRSRLHAAVVTHITAVNTMLHVPGISQENFAEEAKRLTDLQKAVDAFMQK